jgi:hypothetical protein
VVLLGPLTVLQLRAEHLRNPFVLHEHAPAPVSARDRWERVCIGFTGRLEGYGRRPWCGRWWCTREGRGGEVLGGLHGQKGVELDQDPSCGGTIRAGGRQRRNLPMLDDGVGGRTPQYMPYG